MDWDELAPLLNKLEDTRQPAKITNAIAKAKKEIEFKGGFADFIKMIANKDEGIKPKLNVVPPRKRLLLDPFLEVAYQCFLEGGFNHRKDVDMFEAYCSPLSDKYGKYLDEMSIQQRKVFAMMNEDMIAHKRRKSTPYEDGTIENALDNAIKAKVRKRETGDDTTE